MPYVTQGTVQLEWDGTTGKVLINPIPDYAVKYNEKDYIVFVPEPPSARFEAKLVDKKTESLTIDKKDLVPVVIEAAFKNKNIEIRTNDDCTRVEAVKIPAGSRSHEV